MLPREISTKLKYHCTKPFFNFCGVVLIYRKEGFKEIFGVGFFKNLVAAEIEINCMYIVVSQFLLPSELKILSRSAKNFAGYPVFT